VDCESVREDIEAYALGALDAVARRRVEAHLRTCNFCRDLVRAYAAVVGELALAVPLVRARPRLKERVLGSVGAFRPTVTPATLVRTSRWWAVAAVLFLAFAIGSNAWAISLSVQVNRLKSDNAHLAELTELDADQRAALLSELARAKTQQSQMANTLAEQATLIVLALDSDLIPTDLQGTPIAPEAQCRYVWSTKQSMGALTCQKMPAISFSLNYNLWAVRGDKVVSLGTFSPRSDGTAHLLVKPTGDPNAGPITNMFVTLEQVNQTPKQPSAEVILQRAPEQQAAR
jgi:anti-sigma-K factor RskA